MQVPRKVDAFVGALVAPEAPPQPVWACVGGVKLDVAGRCPTCGSAGRDPGIAGQRAEALLLERERERAELLSAVRAAGLGNGSAALVHGEAGIGKTSLVRAFLHEVEGHARLLVGACDDLRTPRPLGPFRDAAADGAGALAQALRDGDRDAIYSAVTRELSERTPTVLVVEDVHWADDATLGAALLGAAARPAARTGDPHLPRR